MRPLEFDRVEDLRDPAQLARITGPIAAIERLVMPTCGFSGSTHERFLIRPLGGGPGDDMPVVLKHTVHDRDWMTVRSADTWGREAALVADGDLASVWTAFSCPYLAFASQPGEIGLLMHDLTDHLLPDVRAPLARDQEDRLLAAIAALHATHWHSPALDRPWLMSPAQVFSLLPPDIASQDERLQPPPEFRDRVHLGWRTALDRLPSAAARLVAGPSHALAAALDGLPRTLLHGDVKVANFGLRPNGRVAAFDWALVAAGPPTLELGWYLAVNATRLARSKEDVLARYRELLESGLGRRLDDDLWPRLEDAAIVNGARSLLWSKALALGRDDAASRVEWAWWVERLEGVASRSPWASLAA